ncbi:mitotic checkpoint regulator, MAD2B-interacting-domain-containing protein [Pyrenochaeta sp. MPI-SDFR-AT-0127]|nr:mitotic checkpoint regulator, MAD2B-interacting-domain-containing protein [Pyrenochaeta sp. MPI-SDFR-AT-0127]
MNLTAYSDSESDSDGGGSVPPPPKPAARPLPKAAFQKVVNRSNPGRIKVNLPGALQPLVAKDDIDDETPPAKKPRLGGGGAFGGFNAMLPAPKKPNVTTTLANASAAAGKRGLGKGLAAGVNLKTGAEPAFRREQRADIDEYDENGNPVKKEPMQKEDFRAMLKLPPSKAATLQVGVETAIDSISVEPQVPKPALPQFVPMSVGKGKRKKPVAPRPAAVTLEEAKESSINLGALKTSGTESRPARKPKVSLFGVPNDPDAPARSLPDGQYQPLLHVVENEEHGPVTISNGASDSQSSYHPTYHAPSQASGSTPNDLTNIASELNLSEAERRQLFGKKGRGGPDVSSAKIVEFNTDTEYAHNERVRQQGEQVQHNALKSISGTGKNSLRSLVSQATSQKDALEDHFASGHRNKREAGNRYGW